MAKPTISKHLDVLENAGLIKSEKKGQYVYYSLVRENLVTCMYDFIANFCPVSGPLKKESRKLAAKKKRNRHGSF
jgi:ArsR family transcriptional regulator, arsenate/arsenite/antimonite-responsive transcriptional repressor